MTNSQTIKRHTISLANLRPFIGVFFLALVFSLSMNAQTAARSQRMGIAPSDEVQLVYAEGIITMNGIDIDIGAIIPDNALIKTGKGSFAEIAFKTKNVIRIGENTTARVSLSGMARKIDLQQGTFTAVLHRLEKVAGGSLELKTPIAVGGVRGTSFCSKVEANGYTYFCSCNGTLALKDTEATSVFDQASAHHKGIWFTKDGTGVKTKPAGMEYHNDADLESLAARIGDTMDWTSLEH